MERRKVLRLFLVSSVAAVIAPKLTFGQIPVYKNLDFSSLDFGADFKWGVATAAYQIEGAHNLDGKSASIWDTFSHEKGTIKTGENGDVACDFYHSFEQDLDLLKSLNMTVFRFSIAWSRILPNGVGAPNQKGIDFYHRVIDACLERGLEPWLTLYHWDLPQVLQDQGGWMNRASVSWFSEYVEFISKTYGDKVKNWMVFNEPSAFTALGYLIGYHAPGLKGFRHYLPTVHHVCLCQAEGGRIIRKNVINANIGTTFSCSHVDVFKSEKRDGKSAKRWDVLLNRLFIEPALGMGYPTASFPILSKLKKYILPGDLEKLKFDFDFIGVQNYTREVVKKMGLIPIMKGLEIPPKKRNVTEITDMGWEVYPEGIYQIIKQFAAYPNVKKIFVTENGCAFPDELIDGKVNDVKRIDYYQRYLKQVLRAKQEGVNIGGYFSWTLLDNFEWSEGFKPRFGLVYVDFKTQKRIVKESGYWFKDFLKKVR
jgi:beta-glucosidase